MVTPPTIYIRPGFSNIRGLDLNSHLPANADIKLPVNSADQRPAGVMTGKFRKNNGLQ